MVNILSYTIIHLPNSKASPVTRSTSTYAGDMSHTSLLSLKQSADSKLFQACIKFSILSFYHRIFSVSRPFIITLWCVGVFIFCYSMAQTFGAIFQCVPIRAAWDPTVPRRCIRTDLGATIIAALNVVTDFVVLTLPMPLLWHLQSSRKQRYQIMGIFLLGGL